MLLFLISGCTASGYVINTGNANLTSDNINKIVKGTTTKAEIFSILGPPQSKMSYGVIGETWTYTLTTQTRKDEGGLKGFFSIPKETYTTSAVTVIFTPDDIVKDFTFFESNNLQTATFQYL